MASKHLVERLIILIKGKWSWAWSFIYPGSLVWVVSSNGYSTFKVVLEALQKDKISSSSQEKNQALKPLWKKDHYM